MRILKKYAYGVEHRHLSILLKTILYYVAFWMSLVCLCHLIAVLLTYNLHFQQFCIAKTAIVYRIIVFLSLNNMLKRRWTEERCAQALQCFDLSMGRSTIHIYYILIVDLPIDRNRCMWRCP